MENQIMTICEYNPIDGNYYVKDDDGLVFGIASTPELAIEEAEFYGLNCNNITIRRDIL